MENLQHQTINDLIALIVYDLPSADCMKHKREKCSLMFDETIHREATPKSEQKIVPQ